MKNLPNFSPSVSVIIAVYNAEPFLAEAIESVLRQTLPPQQVIVIDDGSTDQSAKIARRYLPYIQLEQQPNAGSPSARNRGVALAKGDLLAFLDADDFWTPEKLALQIEALQRSPDLEAVFGQLKQMNTLEIADQDNFLFSNDVTDGCHLDTLLIWRNAFQRIGPFDPLWIIDVVEWLWRARRMELRTEILPHVLAWRRIHGDNESIRERTRSRREYFQLIRQQIKQQRQHK